jgi:hypothetical protein
LKGTCEINRRVPQRAKQKRKRKGKEEKKRGGKSRKKGAKERENSKIFLPQLPAELWTLSCRWATAQSPRRLLSAQATEAAVPLQLKNSGYATDYLKEMAAYVIVVPAVVF